MEPKRPRRRALPATIAAAVVALVTAFVTAIVLAVADLYLTGHGRPSLLRPFVAGLSAGDIIMLLMSAGAGMGVGTLIWRRGR